MDNKQDKIYLNLGCGNDIRPGWYNIDLPANDLADINLNLEDAKLPFDDNTVQFIECSHVLEHVNNYIPLMQEIYRVLEPNGILHVCVPEFPCSAAIADPTHVRFFTPHSFTYLSDKTIGYDTSGLHGLFELKYIESLPHDRGVLDRAQIINNEVNVFQRYFTEIEVELEKIGQKNE